MQVTVEYKSILFPGFIFSLYFRGSCFCGFGGLVIDTAGGFVDKDNIEQIAPLAEKGVR